MAWSRLTVTWRSVISRGSPWPTPINCNVPIVSLTRPPYPLASLRPSSPPTLPPSPQQVLCLKHDQQTLQQQLQQRQILQQRAMLRQHIGTLEGLQVAAASAAGPACAAGPAAAIADCFGPRGLSFHQQPGSPRPPGQNALRLGGAPAGQGTGSATPALVIPAPIPAPTDATLGPAPRSDVASFRLDATMWEEDMIKKRWAIT